MCVISLALGLHTRWPVLLAGNRDEFHARPTAALARWSEPQWQHIIAGRDLQAGGSWLGLSEQGRLAVVTNIRCMDPPLTDAPSRGALVTSMLDGSGLDGSGANTNICAQDLNHYNPFHLLHVDAHGVGRHMTNRPEGEITPLCNGLFSFANEAKSDICARRDSLHQQVEAFIRNGSDNPGTLLNILRQKQSNIPGARPNFLVGSGYGTRATTLIMIERDGTGLMIELSFAAMGRFQEERRVHFRWPVTPWLQSAGLGSGLINATPEV